MKNCKSTKSFCRSILAIYTNVWSTFWYVYCCYFFSGKFLNVRKPRTKTSLLTAWTTWIDILWKWASMLTKLAGDSKCRLALFHAIRNFLSNEIYHFSRLSHQTNFLLEQPAAYNELLIKPLYRSWDYSEHFGIHSQLNRESKTCFCIFLSVYVSWIERDKNLISQLSPSKFRYFADQNGPKVDPIKMNFWQVSNAKMRFLDS